MATYLIYETSLINVIELFISGQKKTTAHQPVIWLKSACYSYSERMQMTVAFQHPVTPTVHSTVIQHAVRVCCDNKM